MLFSKSNISQLITALALLTQVACGGGGSTGGTPVNGTLSGTAAVGDPIVGGTIKVVCAGGSGLTGAPTSGSGAWQVTLSGQSLPCAVQVSAGTINGVANVTSYHSIAIALGTVNVTSLSDLMVANLAGSATPATWFNGLTTNPAALTSIGQAQVDGALTKLRGAMSGLAPLSGINPITTVFTATHGNVSDDMLSALKSAMTSTGVSYQTLLSNAAAPAFTAPAAGFASAMTSAYQGTVSGTPAVTIPATPASVTVAASGTTQVNVNWGNVSGATSYNIYRSSSPSVQIVAANKINPASPLLTAGPFSNTGLTAATTYYYRVTAVNSAGESIGSAEVSAATNAVAATPTVIGFLPASGASGTTVTISGTNLGSFTPAPLVKFGGTTATSTLSNGQTILAVVPAGLATGNSAITVANGDGSGSISVGTFAVTAAPSAPAGVTAAVTSSSQISLSWTAVTGATGYNVYRSTSAGVQAVAGNKVTATALSASPFSDTGLAASTHYYYKVTALNASGESAASAEVTASTNAASGSAGSAIGTGLYSAVLPADNAAFLVLLNTACSVKTALSDGTLYTQCTQPANASFASNLTANMYVGGLPHQTGGNVVSGPSSYAPSTAKVNSNQGMAGVALNDSCTVSIPEPYIPIVLVEVKGARYYPAGINFNFKGTGDDTITVTSAGVVNEYTMTNGQGGKIEVHPNLALFGASQSGSEAAVGTVVNGGWTNYFLCK